MGNIYRPGAASLLQQYPTAGAAPSPGKATLTQDLGWLGAGAKCDGPTVGVCTLDRGMRGRLVQLTQLRIQDAHSGYRTGAAMAYTDLRTMPDGSANWLVDLGLQAVGLALMDSVGKAIGRLGKWAAGAENAAYERLFQGEFVSERALALYGAASRVPFSAIKRLSDASFKKGLSQLPKAVAPKPDRVGAELVLRLLLQQAALGFDRLQSLAPAQLDDAQLLALYESLDPAEGTSEFAFRDQIADQLRQFHDLGLEEIGRHHEVDSAGGHELVRGAVWIADWSGNARLALIEKRDAVMRQSKGEYLHEAMPPRRRFLGWVDDPVMREAAEQLTRDRGNGNVGTIDAGVAEATLEGFRW